MPGGTQQSAISGRPVDVEPSVRVTDSFGNPVAGLEVVFDVITGGGFAALVRDLAAKTSPSGMRPYG